MLRRSVCRSRYESTVRLFKRNNRTNNTHTRRNNANIQVGRSKKLVVGEVVGLLQRVSHTDEDCYRKSTLNFYEVCDSQSAVFATSAMENAREIVPAVAPLTSGKSPPASNSAIRSLPLVHVTIDDLLEESNKECLVCLEGHRIGSLAYKLACGHLFHTPCITKWLQKHCTCETSDLNNVFDNAIAFI